MKFLAQFIVKGKFNWGLNLFHKLMKNEPKKYFMRFLKSERFR